MSDFNLWLIQAWTQQLYREYDNILFQQRVKLRPPIICIEDQKSKWGQWNPSLRIIMISRALIEHYSWDVVIEVLKHEMAHQLVTEHYGHDHTHGEPFLMACKRLGVASWATRAAGDLPESVPSWKDRVLSDEEERLLKRAEKLLALATSSNEHESLLAMQRVRELYARHNIEQIQSLKQTEKVFLIINRKKKRIEASESMIFSILSEHFFVQIIFNELYDAKTQEKHKTAEIFGTRENVLMAEYVYYFLWRQIHALWDAYQAGAGKTVKSKKSYMVGVLTGFRNKLASSEEAGATQSCLSKIEKQSIKALTILAQNELDAFVRERHPRISTRRSGGGCRDQSAYHAGVADGRDIVLSKGITSQGGASRLLLKG
jgi:hypothetical protein